MSALLTGSPFVLRVAVGRAPAPCALWLMYTHGLAARSVGLGSGPAGWAVAPADFFGSWIRGGGGLLGQIVGVGLPSVLPPLWYRFAMAGSTVRCSFVRAGRCRQGAGGCVRVFRRPRWGGACTISCVVAFSLCAVGWCGGVPRLWACFFPFLGVRLLLGLRLAFLALVF